MKGFCGFHSWRLPSITFFLYCHDLVRVLRHESRFCLYPIHNACLQQVIWRKNPLLLHVGDIPKVACASRAARAIKFKVGCIVVVVNWRVVSTNDIYWQFSSTVQYILLLLVFTRPTLVILLFFPIILKDIVFLGSEFLSSFSYDTQCIDC
jgi:hypothetical protein